MASQEHTEVHSPAPLKAHRAVLRHAAAATAAEVHPAAAAVHPATAAGHRLRSGQVHQDHHQVVHLQEAPAPAHRVQAAAAAVEEDNLTSQSDHPDSKSQVNALTISV